MAKKWETPRILVVDALPKTLGDCLGGSTDGATTGGDYCGCHDGQNTFGTGVRAAGTPGNTSLYLHGCSSGGTPGTCFCGEAATDPN